MKVYVVKYSDWDTNEIYAICTTKEIAEAFEKQARIEFGDEYDLSIEEEKLEDKKPIIKKDYNRGQVKVGEHFKLEGSDDIFVYMKTETDDVFVDITTFFVYRVSDIFDHLYGFNFYTNPYDEDFFGVEVIEGE